METARSAEPKKIVNIQNVSRPFSNFDYCEKTFPDKYPLKILPVRRLLSQFRSYKGRTFITEELCSSDDIRAEDEEIRAKCPKTFKESKIFRLSFFNSVITSLKSKSFRFITNKNFLGYAIIKQNIFKDYSSYNVFESVFKQSTYPNNFIHAGNIFTVNIIEKRFDIKGALYCQQNRVTNVCAHSALRTLLSSLEKNKSITTTHINQILGIDHKKHKLHDLSYNEILKILRAFNLKYYQYKKTSQVVFEKYLYSSIESGNIALLGFTLAPIKEEDPINHVVPVIGHTFNQDTWISNAEQFYFNMGRLKYLPSDSWTSTFIIHDDNFGSHYCFPPKYLDQTKVKLCIGTIKDDATSDPLQIEPIAVEMLKNIMKKLYKYNLDKEELKWLKRLFLHTRANKVIFRTLLLKKEKYISLLKKLKGWKYDRVSSYFIDNCQEILPPIFWMVEISIPELFSINRRKLGELVLDCKTRIESQTQPDWNLLLFARLPGCFFVKSREAPLFYKISPNDHVSLYPLSK